VKRDARAAREKIAKEWAAVNLLQWLNEPQEEAISDWVASTLGTLQKMHRSVSRVSTYMNHETFTEDEYRQLIGQLADVPLYFQPCSWRGGKSFLHPCDINDAKGRAVVLLAQAWSGNAIEHVRQCQACSRWFFGRPDKKTCGATCRQAKSRKNRKE
jgi:hypothetical protein